MDENKNSASPDQNPSPKQPEDISEPEHAAQDAQVGDAAATATDTAAELDQEEEKLHCEIEIEEPSLCERHIVVTVPRDEVERYFDRHFKELRFKATVPGFRPGHVPRRLLEKRFRRDVAEQVKAEIILQAIEQVTSDYKLVPISEPDLDIEAVEIPEEGPFTFEFDLEVRPQFDLPDWKGIQIERPVWDITDELVDRALKRVLRRFGELVPHDGPADVGDYIVANLRFEADGEVLSQAEGEVICIRPVLSFEDGEIRDFDKLMKGVKAGQTITATPTMAPGAVPTALAGREIKAVFEVEEVKRLRLPEIDDNLLQTLGGYESEAQLRDAIRDQLAAQLAFRQRERAREQIIRHLLAGADWELPPRLLRQQQQRELMRIALELESSGFSAEDVRAYINSVRHDIYTRVSNMLRSHFILERIAEEENIDVTEDDIYRELLRIAWNTGEPVRRVRARIEKEGAWDVIRNQVLEQKVFNLIFENAELKDVREEPPEEEIEALELRMVPMAEAEQAEEEQQAEQQSEGQQSEE